VSIPPEEPAFITPASPRARFPEGYLLGGFDTDEDFDTDLIMFEDRWSGLQRTFTPENKAFERYLEDIENFDKNIINQNSL
jgi:hypothetical protein